MLVLSGNSVWADESGQTNFVWTGAAGSVWDNATNWNILSLTNTTRATRPPNSPQELDYVTFSGTTKNRTIDLGSTLKSVAGLSFAPSPGNSSGYTFNTSGLNAGSSGFGFALGPQGIINTDTHPELFNAPIKLVNYGGGTLNGLIDVAIKATPGALVFSGVWRDGPANVPTLDLNGATVVFQGSGNITFGAHNAPTIISSSGGGGSLIMNGTGTLILDGTSANTYTGGTFINSGSVYAGKFGALGNQGALSVNGTGYLNVGNANESIGQLHLGGGTIAGGNATITLTSRSNNIESGSISANLAGIGGITKTTTGQASLSGTNFYSGGTEVVAGALFVDGYKSTGVGPVQVDRGATLGGVGVIQTPLTLASGSILEGGDAGVPGTLTTAKTLWSGGLTLNLQMNQANGKAGANPGWGVVKSSGVVTISATPANPITINLTSLTLGGQPGNAANFNPDSVYTWLFATAAGSFVGFNTNQFKISTIDFANDPGDKRFFVEVLGKTNLYLVHVPEPGVGPLAVLGLGVLLFAGVVGGRRLR